MSGKKYRRWTSEEVEFLRDNAANMTLIKLSEILGRNANSVKGKMYGMGLKIGVRKQHADSWTAFELQFLKENSANMTLREIGEMLGKSTDTVSKKRIKLGLKPYISQKSLPGTNGECSLERTKNICTWWLTGDTIEDIRRLYQISENDVLAALRHNDGKTLKRQIVENDGGAYRIKRTAKEIAAMIT